MFRMISAASRVTPTLTRYLSTKAHQLQTPLRAAQLAIRTSGIPWSRQPTQREKLSFTEFKNRHVESYKAYCSPAIRELCGGDNALMETSYREHCEAVYNEYVRRLANPTNNPATML